MVTERSGIVMKLSGFDHKISVSVTKYGKCDYYGFIIVVV